MANRNDSFNRANASGGLGTPSDGGSAWVELASNFGVFSNQAYAAGGGNPTISYLECASADGSVSLKFPSGSCITAIAFRINSATNECMYVRCVGGSPALYRYQSGTSNLVNSAGTVVANDTVSVDFTSSTITVKINGTTAFTSTSSFNSTLTKHGMIATPGDTSLMDDWAFVGGAPLTLTQADGLVDYSSDALIHLTAPAATGGTPAYSYQWKRASTANGTYANVGTNSLILSDSSGLVAGQTYWYTVTATDSAGSPQTTTTRPVAAKLTGKALKARILGDSQWATSDYSGGTNAADTTFVAELLAILAPRQVSLGGNSAIGGTRSADWIPGAAGTPLEAAVTAANASGDNLFVVYLGSNDSTASGSTPITPAVYKTNVASIVNYILAHATATPILVVLIKTAWYSLDPATYNNDHVETLFEYNARLDELASGTTVYTVGDLTRFQVCQAPTTYIETNGVHLTHTTGQILSGKNAARDLAGKLQFAGSGSGGGGGQIIG